MPEVITPENQAYMDRTNAMIAERDMAQVQYVLDTYPEANSDGLKNFAKVEYASVRKLIEKYGVGIRPSWVSAEMAALEYQGRIFKLAAKKRERQEIQQDLIDAVMLVQFNLRTFAAQKLDISPSEAMGLDQILEDAKILSEWTPKKPKG
jgi:DNA-directed RNA polymerase subunit F